MSRIDPQTSAAFVKRWNQWRNNIKRKRPINLPNVQVQSADFKTINFSQVTLSRAEFKDSDLSESDLRYSNLEGVWFEQVCLKRAQFQGAIMPFSHLRQVDLSEADLTLSMVHHSCWENVFLTGAQLNRVNLSHVELNAVCLVDCSLNYAYFRNAKLSYLILTAEPLTKSSASLSAVTMPLSTEQCDQFKQDCLKQLNPLQLAQIQWFKQFNVTFQIGRATPILEDETLGDPYPIIAVQRMDSSMNSWSRIVLFNNGYHTTIQREADDLSELISPRELNGHKVQWWILISHELLPATPEMEEASKSMETMINFWSLSIMPKLREVFGELERA